MMDKYEFASAVGMMHEYFIEESMKGSGQMRERIITKWSTLVASIVICAVAVLVGWQMISGGFEGPTPLDTIDGTDETGAQDDSGEITHTVHGVYEKNSFEITVRWTEKAGKITRVDIVNDGEWYYASTVSSFSSEKRRARIFVSDKGRVEPYFIDLETGELKYILEPVIENVIDGSCEYRIYRDDLVMLWAKKGLTIVLLDANTDEYTIVSELPEIKECAILAENEYGEVWVEDISRSADGLFNISLIGATWLYDKLGYLFGDVGTFVYDAADGTVTQIKDNLSPESGIYGLKPEDLLSRDRIIAADVRCSLDLFNWEQRSAADKYVLAAGKLWAEAHYPGRNVVNVYELECKQGESQLNINEPLLREYYNNPAKGGVCIRYVNVDMSDGMTVPLSIIYAYDETRRNFVLTGIEMRSRYGEPDVFSKSLYNYVSADPRLKDSLKPYYYEVELGEHSFTYRVDTEAVYDKLAELDAQAGYNSYNISYRLVADPETYDGKSITLYAYPKNCVETDPGETVFIIEYDLLTDAFDIRGRLTDQEEWDEFYDEYYWNDRNRYYVSMNADREVYLSYYVNNDGYREILILDEFAKDTDTQYSVSYVGSEEDRYVAFNVYHIVNGDRYTLCGYVYDVKTGEIFRTDDEYYISQMIGDYAYIRSSKFDDDYYIGYIRLSSGVSSGIKTIEHDFLRKYGFNFSSDGRYILTSYAVEKNAYFEIYDVKTDMSVRTHFNGTTSMQFLGGEGAFSEDIYNDDGRAILFRNGYLYVFEYLDSFADQR